MLSNMMLGKKTEEVKVKQPVKEEEFGAFTDSAPQMAVQDDGFGDFGDFAEATP